MAGSGGTEVRAYIGLTSMGDGMGRGPGGYGLYIGLLGLGIWTEGNGRG